MTSYWFYPVALLISVLLHAIRKSKRNSKPPRWRNVPPATERVLVIGASSGVGREIALRYSRRGAGGIAIVGRRKEELGAVKRECELLTKSPVLAIAADCSIIEDVSSLTRQIEKAWGWFDTLIICAGVSSVRPVMDIAGYRHSTHDESGTYDTSDGVQKVNDVIERSLKGNFLGPVLSAVALIPLLLRKPTLSGSPSPSPSILLLSSIAGAIPAPTRSIYASTKSASLVFFQSLSIEWSSKLDFSIILPGSIEGDDFRKKAVDLDLNPAPESSTSMSTSMGTTSPRELEGPEETVRTPEGRGNETGVSTQLRREGKKLRREDVARACIDVIDWKRKGTITNIVWLPSWPYRYAHLVYWWAFRGFVERGAKKKYGFVH